MAEYWFVTLWQVEAPLEAVYDAVFHSLRWPEWWQGAECVEHAEDGDADGIGSVRRYTWKPRLPYRLQFDARTTRIEPLVALEAAASGDLEGMGKWSFSHDAGITRVRYEWRVRTTRPWMNWLAPIARPLFAGSHHHLMQQGAEGLARRLKARLVEVEHISLPAPVVSTPGFGWRAGAMVGIGAGIAATLVQLVLWWLAARPVLGMLLRDSRLAAAIVMGTAVLTPERELDWAVLLVATVLHFALSALYGLILALLLSRLAAGLVLAAGAAFGLILYGVNMHGFTALFPWFAASRDWITVLAHLAFGLSGAWMYRVLREKA